MEQNKLDYWKTIRRALLPIVVGTLVLVTCNNRTAGNSGKNQSLETKANSVAVVAPAPDTVQIPSTYTVQNGDTLWGLSRGHEPDYYNRLKNANPGINHDKLRPGQVINLPNSNSIRKYSISERGIEFIKRKEGFNPEVYNDYGWPAIGYGHRLVNGENLTKISESEADALLRRDIKEKYGPAVEENVTVALNQSQYDVLCDFVYNIGPGDFKNAGALKELNRGNYKTAAARMKRWNKVTVTENGKKRLVKSKSLVQRRQEEYNLFLSR